MIGRDFPFALPRPPGAVETPLWTGRGFQIGESVVPLLSYEVGSAGWSDELTELHEREAGSSHFIDVASRRIAIEQVRRHCRNPGAATMLDIGCSSGFLLEAARREFPGALVLGADVVPRALAALALRQPDLPLLHFDLTRCPLPDACLDVVFLLNVLEHIEDDGAAVRQVFRVLKPGAIAVVEVPAGPELYDGYDRLLMHFRRYRQRDVVKLFRGAGFELLRRSHLGCFVYPGFYAVKRLRRDKSRALSQAELEAMAKKDIGKSGNPLLGALTRLEVSLGGLVSYPFGIRCLLTVRKP